MNIKAIGKPIIRVLVVSAGILIMILVSISPSFAGTKWSVGVTGNDDGISGFHLSIGEYYRVPHREVVVVHQQGICHEDLPVVFFIAKRACVHPDMIARMRLRGMTWMDITLHFGLGPDIYFIPGCTGGKRYHPGLKHRHLSDHDIVNQVNLIFLSGYHRCPPDRIVKYRSQGKSYVVIDREFTRERHKARTHDKDLQQKPKKDRDDWGDRRSHQDKGWKNDRRDTNGSPGHHGTHGNNNNRGDKGGRDNHRKDARIIARIN
ncbi:MAG: hypothetical protein QM299_14690 [Pseudomonadota bacterium]|jgi:hypothetical protein|uniref:Uncharacterized protein n=1 Tax=anaerobic digester metagenome TaxID=1263854 RepID=A0A485M0H6_9ZZZZ|nr:hypothetical protein [Pseudomonadota bacterium]HPD20613.1 hypothetical protein [Deltaproteobacteria bacterium]HRS55465.1 hypothetical protein [Desulfomonilia bacterium]HRV35122.1 hypothetical protein [Desulfomonilia bacterium]